MNDTGMPWLGAVPSHWRLLRLKSLVSNVVEQTTERAAGDEYVALEHVESWTGLRKAVGPDTTFDGQVKRFRPDDVLFGKLRPYLAKVTRPAVGGVCVGEFLVLRVRDLKSVPSFVEHWLRSKPVIEAINSSTFGAKMPRADWQFIGAMTVALPPPTEQKAIVGFLEHAERRVRRYIRAKQKLIRLLEERKQAIIHSVVTRGVDPTVRLKPSGVRWIGDVPEHWDVVPLGRILMQRKEKNDPIQTTDILSLSLRTGVIPYADKPAGGNKAKDDLSSYMLAYPGDIVVNSMNVVVGSVGLSTYFGAVSPVYYMLRPRESRDAVEYFDLAFQDRVFQRSLFGLGNGIMYVESKSGKLNTIRLRIPMARLRRVELPRPSTDEQMAIVRHLNGATATIRRAVDRTQREVDLLQEYLASLIANAVTGKFDVRDAASHLSDDFESCESLDEAEADADAGVEEPDNGIDVVSEETEA